ncbi:MAG TPA: CocE/NonD family hydrolase, partial [Baekduia sp.]|nr:CocE/NonD family hydrolase [Baekduia sp.]
MGRRWRRAAAAVAIMATAAPGAASAADGDGGAWTSYTRPAQYATVTDQDVPITMRDGTVLKANVTRPDAPGTFPVLVTQTPYGKDGAVILALGGATDALVQRGYVQVTVDVRGTGKSAGSWDSFGPSEQQDGYDVVEWAARQPWSTGAVGLDGPSYMGLTQLYTAALRPPHLKAIFPVVPMADGYRDIVFSGGDVNISFIPLWLGLVTGGGLIADPITLLQHVGGALSFTGPTLIGATTGGAVAYDGPFWKTRSPIEVLDEIQVPAFVVGGLHDLFQRGEPLVYERLKSRVPSRLLMGPWTHVGGSQGSGLPADGVPSLTDLQLRWFDKYLKGIDTNIAGIPKVTQYNYGDERYETQADWPDPKLDPQRWYLRGGGVVSRSAPGVSEPSQTFVQQPLSGVCTMSTGQWTAGLGEPLPCFTDDRPNALSGGASYLSEPLSADLRLNGPIAARLWVTTTAADAAVAVRVDDVAPDGTSSGITTGWQTAALRATDAARTRTVRGHVLQPWHPFTKESVLPVTAGAPTALDVEVFPTSWVLKAGHRLKIVVDPADFPHAIPPLPALLARLGGQVSVLTDP